jgi:hypothetical protein
MSGSKNLEWNATRHAVYTVGRLTSRRGPYARERERERRNRSDIFVPVFL